MTRRIFFFAFSLAISLIVALATGSLALASSRSVSVSTDDRGGLERCDQIKVRFGGEDRTLETVRAEERFESSRAEIAKLRIAFVDAGGIDVRGWDRDRYQITVCKAAGAPRSSGAQEVLDRIRVSFHDGSLETAGPDDQNWFVFALVRVPRDADLDLSTENGGISLSDVSGHVRTRSENGPVGLTKCSGDVRADTENGPIHSEGCADVQTLSTRNGPVSIELGAGKWTGEGLTARTENGPLSVTIGKGAPAVRIETAQHTLLSCRAEGCASARRSRGGEGRRIEIGEGRPMVRLSTVNGPVAVKGPSGRSGAAKAEDDDDEDEADVEEIETEGVGGGII